MLKENIKTVYCRKPDLDCLTAAFLLGLRPKTSNLVLVPGLAPAEALGDPEVICLECGGSGQTQEQNFDHHDPLLDLPTATQQVWLTLGSAPQYKDLVNFVAWLDTAGKRGSPPYFSPEPDNPANFPPSVSTLLSGLFLLEKDLQVRFWSGLELIEQVFLSGLPPWDLSSWVDRNHKWGQYLEAKTKASQELANLESEVIDLTGGRPFLVLGLSTEYYGVHGLLRKMGAEIRVAHNPESRKISVSVDEQHQAWLQKLSLLLNSLEPGWGGPTNGTILGSPFQGTEYEFSDFCKKFIIEKPDNK